MTSKFLAANLSKLRAKRNMSQLQLAKLAGVPRSTLTHMESGEGNPSLDNLVKVSSALGVGIEELLSRPRNDCVLIRATEIDVRTRGSVEVRKLMPDKVKGIELERLEFAPGAVMGGHPHLLGTKEYLHVLQGEVTVHVAGEAYAVARGDVLAFPGNQPHSYRNTSRGPSVAISMVIPVPP